MVVDATKPRPTKSFIFTAVYIIVAVVAEAGTWMVVSGRTVPYRQTLYGGAWRTGSIRSSFLFWRRWSMYVYLLSGWLDWIDLP